MSESKKVYVLNVVVSLISPVRLAGEDKIKEILGIDQIPKTMRALLAQEVIDRKILNPLGKIKKRVRDTLLKYGTREPLLGWVIDPDRISALKTELEKHRADFEKAKSDLLAGYADSCAQHIEALREACLEEGVKEVEVFLDVIGGSQPTEAYLRSQLQYRYLEPRPIELHEEEFQLVVEGLFGQAIGDIARRAEEAQKALRSSTKLKALDEIEAKLQGLSYLDGRFGAIASQVVSLIRELPRGTPNEEWDTRSQWALSGALDLLSDRERLVQRLEQEEALFAVPAVSAEPEEPTVEPATPDVVSLFPEGTSVLHAEPEAKPDSHEAPQPSSERAAPGAALSSQEEPTRPEPAAAPETGFTDVHVIDVVSW